MNIVLIVGDFNNPIKLVIDAGNIGVGDALVQGDEEAIDTPHPLKFCSKKLNQTPEKIFYCGKGNTVLDLGFITLRCV